jgi:putative hydrolase of the HAD superfamily
MRLQTVFLDAGGVLLFPNWTRISDALHRHGVEVEAEVLASAEPHAKKQLDVSRTIQVTNDAARGWIYFNLVLEHAGIPLSPATDAALQDLHAYHTTSNLWEHVPEHVPSVLDALRERGLRLVVVSNANGTLPAHLRRLGLEHCFHVVLDSCNEGVEKPDPRFFEIALQRSGASRDTTIHVGDLYEVDVVGARAAGLRGVLLDEAGLYPDADCLRIQSLAGLVDAIDAGTFNDGML